jgi:hypothetical protein
MTTLALNVSPTDPAATLEDLAKELATAAMMCAKTVTVTPNPEGAEICARAAKTCVETLLLLQELL